MVRADSFGFWPVPAALLALAAVAWWAMQPQPPEKRDTAQTPAVEARGARSIIVREGGRKAWEFSAKRITIAPNRILATIEGVQNGVIFQAGKPLWRLNATLLKANQLTRDIEAQNAVASLAKQDLRITTARALWKHRQKTLLCPLETRANTKDIQVSTRSASYNVARDELRCAGGVEVASRFGTIAAPHATAFPKSRRVEFGGGVEIVMRRSALPLPGG